MTAEALPQDWSEALWKVAREVISLFAPMTALRAGIADSAAVARFASHVEHVAETLGLATEHLWMHVREDAAVAQQGKEMIALELRSRSAIDTFERLARMLESAEVCARRARDVSAVVLEFVALGAPAGVPLAPIVEAHARLTKAVDAADAAIAAHAAVRAEITEIVNAATEIGYDQDGTATSPESLVALQKEMFELRRRAIASGQPAFWGDAPILDD